MLCGLSSMQQEVGDSGRCAFVNRELGPAPWAMAGMEGVEKRACFPRGSSHPLPFVCLYFPLRRLPFMSPAGIRFRLHGGGPASSPRSLTAEMPAWPGPVCLPPLPLALQQRLWSYLRKTRGLYGTQVVSQ